MLFRQTWEQVLDGTKTEIRLPAKLGEALVENPKRVKSGSRTKWKVGNTYAVQPGNRQKPIGRASLRDIEEGVLEQMGPSDIQAEGFVGLEDFIDVWEGAHGNYDPNQPVWILRFEREPTPEERAARKRAEQEKRLWRMASKEFDRLSAVGHESGEWQPDGDLQLKNTYRRCNGIEEPA